MYNELATFVVCFCCKGDTFHTLLGQVGEVRSLLPENVNVMALTATATTSVCCVVSHILGMNNPYIIAISPCAKEI